LERPIFQQKQQTQSSKSVPTSNQHVTYIPNFNLPSSVSTQFQYYLQPNSRCWNSFPFSSANLKLINVIFS